MNFIKKQSANKKPIVKATVLPIFILTPEYKHIICENSYLGKKGYTIPKSVISKEDDEIIRKELLVKPFIPGGFGAPTVSTDEIAFPVYRESSQKIYLPRFFGLARYGIPMKNCEIEKGEDIDVTFTKPLRDYQDKIVKIYMKY